MPLRTLAPPRPTSIPHRDSYVRFCPLGHEAPVSDAFFRYYWLETPKEHPYEICKIPGYSGEWIKNTPIISLEHLKWGLYRLYVDALLYFGNVRTAFRSLRDMSESELKCLFASKRFDMDAIERRGPQLPLKSISKDRRYLISEMACKSYGDYAAGDLRQALLDAYKRHADWGIRLQRFGNFWTTPSLPM